MNDYQQNQQHKEEEQNTGSERTAEAITKILAIVGLIAILALAAWISVQIIRFSPAVFTSLSEGVGSAFVSLTQLGDDNDTEDTAPTLSVATTHPNAQSGDEVTVDWRLTNAEDGAQNATYTISVPCVEGVTFTAKTNGEEQEIVCDTPFALGESTDVVLIPNTTANESVWITVTVSAENETGEIASRDLSFTVGSSTLATTPNETVSENTSGSSQGTRPVQGTQTVVTYGPPVSDPNGTADLSVRVLATGIKLEKTDNSTFFAVSPIPSDEVAAVKFVVENLGTKTSEEFSFTAQLPVEYDDDFEFESDDQQALRPGEKIEYVLGFDQVREAASGRIVITLSPEGTDASALNNTAVSIISIDEE